MRFYEIDGALTEAIQAGDKPIRVKIEIENTKTSTALPLLSKKKTALKPNCGSGAFWKKM